VTPLSAGARARTPRLAAICLAIGLGAGATAGAAESGPLRPVAAGAGLLRPVAAGGGYLRPVAAQPAPPLPGAPVLGANADLVGLPDARRDALLDDLVEAGVRAVRVPVRWSELEPEPGRIRWSGLDRLVEALEGRGIRLLATLTTSPAWARHDPPPATHLWLCPDPVAMSPAADVEAPPTRPEDLARFAGDLVARYRGRVWAVEVWSEPNLLPRWRRTGPDPEDYAALLVPTAAALEAADPALVVVSAGLGPTRDVGVCFLSDVVFLDRLARTGALAAVDAVGVEPLGLRTGPADREADRERLNFSRAEVLRGVLARHGVDRPLWALAWGWHVDSRLAPGTSDVEAAPWGSHAPDVAARWTRQAWARARAEWPWMGPMFLWQPQPRAPSDDPGRGFAMVDAGGRRLPLWDAVAAIARGEPAPPVDDGPSDPAAGSARTSTRGALPGRLLWPVVLGLALLGLALAVRRPGPPRSGVRTVLAALRGPSTVRVALVYLALVSVDLVAPWPVGLAALAIVGLLSAARPDVALMAVAAAAPYYGRLDLHLGPLPVEPVELLIAVAVGGRALAALVADTPPPAAEGVEATADPLRRGWRAARFAWASLRAAAAPLDWAVAALVAWAALTPLWAEFPAPASREWRTVILEPALFYLLLRSARDRRSAATAALDGLVVGAGAAAVWALAALVGSITGLGGHAVVAEGVLRAAGPYPSPNNLALFLGRMLPVTGAYGLWGTGRRRRAYGAAGLAIALAFLLTFSRGGLGLGLPAVLAYLALVAVGARERRRALRWLAGAVVVGLAVLLPFARTPRIAGALDPRPGGTLFFRLRLWSSAMDMIRDHPVLGVGLDNFLYLYRDRYVRREVAQERFLNHPHDLVLDWWTRLGLPGVVLLVTLVAGNLRCGLRALAGSVAPRDRVLAVAALGMQVYAVAHGLVDNSFFLVDLALAWWVAQAALIALDPAEAG